MFSILLGIFLVLVILLLLYFAFKVLLVKGIFKAWVRGTLALSSLILALFILLYSFDFLSYSSYQNEQKVADITIYAMGDQHFQVGLTVSGHTVSFDVYGDMWQLDARLIVWNDLLSGLGLDTLYRLDRLSGRYESTEDEYSKPRSVYALSRSLDVGDLWQVVTDYPWLPGIQGRYGNGTFVPMVEGAKYSIYLKQGGLRAKPENNQARSAVQRF